MTETNDIRNTSASFIVYSAWGELLRELSDVSAGRLIKALFEYVRTGREPEFKKGSGLSIAFVAIRAQLDINIDKYAQRCEANRRNAIKGARRKAKNTAVSETEPSQAIAEAGKPNDNDNDNDNYNENYYENENDNKNDNDTAVSSDRDLLTAEQFKELSCLSSVGSVETYISKILDWQRTKGRRMRDPYATIKRWIEEDISKAKAKAKTVGQDERSLCDAELEEYERFALNYKFPDI
ncbi:MAG: hypothetical protein IIZ73_03820 [Ruminococcus sp.]|nr:hypothetical protein [Ruminococcus sp.]